MSEEATGDLSLGLSREERAELEQLMKAGGPGGASQLENEEVLREMAKLKARVVQLAARLVELDVRLNTLFEIIHLSHRKSELLCHCIEETLLTSGKKGAE